MKLYRYRTIDDKVLGRRESEILGNIYLSHRKDLNDPFELTTPFPKDNKILNELESVKEQFSKRFSIENREIVDDKCINIHKVIGDDIFKILHDVIGRTRIACFTEKFDNLPMWAHYAGNHTGFVLGYKEDSFSPETRSILHKVDYRKELLFVPLEMMKCLLGMSNPAVKEQIFRQKAEGWAYEEEWRIIGNVYAYCNGDKDKEDELIQNKLGFPIELKPSELYLGIDMADDKKACLAKLAKKARIAVYQMQVTLHGLEATPC